MRREQSTFAPAFIAVVLLLVAVLGGGAMLLLCCAGGFGASSRSTVRTGEVGVLRSGAGVMVCASRSDFTRCTQLSVASDAEGLAQMERSGQLFVVSDGTRARVIGNGFAAVEVRVAEGIHEGKSGFVAAEFVLAKD